MYQIQFDFKRNGKNERVNQGNGIEYIYTETQVALHLVNHKYRVSLKAEPSRIPDFHLEL